MTNHARALSLVLLVSAPLAQSPQTAAPSRPLTLAKGDHIAIVGGGLAERMQHDGWFETLLHARFPELELTVRDLGYAGDEVAVRPRSLNFGTPDEHLRRCRADVVIALFGYNESFAGDAGLARFQADLQSFVAHTELQTYGKAPARVVLCSPIAHERLPDPALPDPAANNARLARYAEAMREVARARGAVFVDLFTPTLAAFARGGEPWTIDGIRLGSSGNLRLAELLDSALFAGPRPADARRDAIRDAVLAKNDTWFHRYRTTDGYSIFGERGELRFVAGQTNRDVMNRELEVLDVMTRNRDRAIWARAQGRTLAVDDANTPPFLPVVTNIPGKGEGGAHVFLDGEAALAQMTVADGLQVNLFASERQFPALVNPNQAAVDPRGRLWVTAWPTYPHWQPKAPRNDKLLILPDDDGDGRADRCIEFASDLHNPTGFEFHDGGVLVAQVPDLWFLKDTDGDDRADLRVRVLSGLDSADTHHSINSFVFSPGGSLYFQEGTFHHTGVETPWGPPARSFNAGVFRFEPRSKRFEVFAAYGFANPHGHVFDRWGQHFVTDGTGAVPYWGTSIGVHCDHPRKLGGAPAVYRQRTRPCGGTAILSSAQFPEAMQGEWLVGNVIGFLGVLRYRFADDGAGYSAQELPPLLQSRDPNFRPVDVKVGGDGAVYVADWHNPIIGHMQHNLRDPSRDRLHGRVYRVSSKDRPTLRPVDTSRASEAELVALLAERDDGVRARARRALSSRPTDKVLAALRTWQAAIPADAAEREHLQLEALWLQQQCGAVDRAHLTRMLASPEPRARAAATRVLAELRHELPDALERLAALVGDAHPRVRAEAVRACSCFGNARAAELALRAAALPLDRYLRYMLRETMLTLRPHWSAAIRAGAPFAQDDPAGLAWLLEMVDTGDLARLPRTAAVCQALLTRSGVPAQERRSALAALAEQRKQSPLTALLTILGDANARGPGSGDLAALLSGWAANELRAELSALQELTKASPQSDVRAAAYGAWLRASDDPTPAWQAASASVAGLTELLRGIAAAESPAPQALWAQVRPLLFEVPATLRGAAGVPGVAYALYEERAFPDVRRETLAALAPKAQGTLGKFGHEVPQISSEPYALALSATLQVPRAGRYTFATASDDGSRLYVDDREVVSNDGPHGVVEQQGSIDLTAGPHTLLVTYYDAGGDDHLRVFWSGPELRRQEIPGAALSVDGGMALRRAAIAAAARIAGDPRAKFAELVRLLDEDAVRAATLATLAQMPCAEMPAELALPVADKLLALANLSATTERGSARWQQTVQVANQVAAAVSPAKADAVRRALTALDPFTITLRTLREKMRYDREEFTVEAGRPVRIELHNDDGMPHNLLILAPGSLEAIGTLADTMGGDGFGRGFVPADPRVLHATRLLNPGEHAALEFTAPTQPGEYPYVCTFPGHWRLMRGVMRVR